MFIKGFIFSIFRFIFSLFPRFLVRRPVITNDVNAQEETPLHHLARKNGYNEAAANPTGEIHRLILQSGTSDIEMSLRRRADSATDQDHDTLYMAAKEGREDVALQILKNVGEAIILYKDKDDNRTAFHVAAIKGQDRLLKKMSKSMSSKCDMKRLILQGDKYKNNPLHYALIGGHEKTARYLVEEAPRAAYKQNHDGDSPLFLAVVNDYPDLVGYMIRTDLSHGIRNDLLDHAKRISLAHTALRKRNQAVFQALLGGLPELIDVPDRKGCKLLSFAAFIGCLNEMRYILQTFPDSIMKNDEDGSLPIHKAVAGGHVNVVKELILCCPQLLHVIDKKGRNIIELATLYQSNDVLAYLNEEQQ